MIKKTLLFLVIVLLLLATAVGINTWRKGSRQLVVTPLAPLQVDEAGAASRLAEAVRLRTVSSRTEAGLNADQFRALHKLLQQRFPRAELRRILAR